MTASYQHLPLSQVQAGMVLSDELLDAHGKVLLPGGTVLTESMLTLMPRHNISTLAVLTPAVPDAELAARRARHAERLASLFRHNDADSDADWATGLLRRYVQEFRLGKEEPTP